MNFRKITVFLTILMLLSASVYAGGAQEPSAESPGETSDLPRVISLGPNITEVIFALGKGDLLVGRTDYCNYPEAALDIASVGSIMEPNVETIIELKPDLIIASTHAPKEAADQLERAGIKVKYYYGPESIDGVYEVISAVGTELDAEAEAESLIKQMKADYEIIKQRTAAVKNRPSVYYAVGFGDGGDWTAGGDTFIGQMIEVAGGRNIAADISGWSFSLERIVEADPDIIIIGNGLRDVFMKAPVYSGLTAVKEGRVYMIDEDMITRQGPRLISGVEQLNAVFTK